MNDNLFEMDNDKLSQSIYSIKYYNDKLSTDMESLNVFLENLEKEWISSGEDIKSIIQEVKNQIIKLQNTKSSLSELVDALNVLQE